MKFGSVRAARPKATAGVAEAVRGHGQSGWAVWLAGPTAFAEFRQGYPATASPVSGRARDRVAGAVNRRAIVLRGSPIR